jgi:hypothetical protein
MTWEHARPLNAAADLLDAIDRRHHRIRYKPPGMSVDYDSCAECAPTRWPCPTARLLHPEDGTP